MLSIELTTNEPAHDLLRRIAPRADGWSEPANGDEGSVSVQKRDGSNWIAISVESSTLSAQWATDPRTAACIGSGCGIALAALMRSIAHWSTLVAAPIAVLCAGVGALAGVYVAKLQVERAARECFAELGRRAAERAG